MLDGKLLEFFLRSIYCQVFILTLQKPKLKRKEISFPILTATHLEMEEKYARRKTFRIFSSFNLLSGVYIDTSKAQIEAERNFISNIDRYTLGNGRKIYSLGNFLFSERLLRSIQCQVLLTVQKPKLNLKDISFVIIFFSVSESRKHSIFYSKVN